MCYKKIGATEKFPSLHKITVNIAASLSSVGERIAVIRDIACPDQKESKTKTESFPTPFPF